MCNLDPRCQNEMRGIPHSHVLFFIPPPPPPRSNRAPALPKPSLVLQIKIARSYPLRYVVDRTLRRTRPPRYQDCDPPTPRARSPRARQLRHGQGQTASHHKRHQGSVRASWPPRRRGFRSLWVASRSAKTNRPCWDGTK